MHCPQCKNRVAVRVLLKSNSLSGIACASCGAELEPVPWTYALVNVAAILAGAGISARLRAAGCAAEIALGSMVLVYLLGFTVLAGSYLRLRAKQRAAMPVGVPDQDAQ